MNRLLALCAVGAPLVWLSAAALTSAPAGSAESPELSAGARPDVQLGPHLEYIQLDSAALRQNLIGDPSVREYAVLLPPSYFASPQRRYPAVYLLHGAGARRDGHLNQVWLLRAAFEQMREGRLGELILVAVDGTTRFGGSYYASSPTIGDFERYVVQELVGDVDRRFRTVAEREGRGIAGFSMGGHGALKLGMRYPEVFAALGSLSGSPMSLRYRKAIYRQALKDRPRPARSADVTLELDFATDWTAAAAYAKAAAFSPNAGRPPLYLDLPFEEEEKGGLDPTWQRWAHEDPLSLVPLHYPALLAMRLVYLDNGDAETALGTEDFDRELVRYGVSHVHHVFAGDHSDDLERRHLRMLRHFAISFDPAGGS